jgi:uncharacterized protein (DUF305 family)
MRIVRQVQSAAVFAAFLAAPAFAQQGAPAQHHMAGMSMSAAGSPADKAMTAGMGRMRRDMASVRITGDPDHDFVAMMLPHHSGAIDMAKVELRYGTDPEMRRLAQSIIDGQSKERARCWLGRPDTTFGRKPASRRCRRGWRPPAFAAGQA